MPTPQPPSAEPLPSWYGPLSMRAYDEVLPDLAIKACLEYVDKLRRERDRLLTQLTALRATREAPGPVLLDRIEAVLDYLGARLGAGDSTVPISEVTGRISGRTT